MLLRKLISTPTPLDDAIDSTPPTTPKTPEPTTPETTPSKRGRFCVGEDSSSASSNSDQEYSRQEKRPRTTSSGLTEIGSGQFYQVFSDKMGSVIKIFNKKLNISEIHTLKGDDERINQAKKLGEYESLNCTIQLQHLAKHAQILHVRVELITLPDPSFSPATSGCTSHLTKALR